MLIWMLPIPWSIASIQQPCTEWANIRPCDRHATCKPRFLWGLQRCLRQVLLSRHSIGQEHEVCGSPRQKRTLRIAFLHCAYKKIRDQYAKKTKLLALSSISNQNCGFKSLEQRVKSKAISRENVEHSEGSAPTPSFSVKWMRSLLLRGIWKQWSYLTLSSEELAHELCLLILSSLALLSGLETSKLCLCHLVLAT